MEILHNLLYGFSVALTPTNLMFCLLGCLIGTLVGVLPGLGPAAAISLLLPVTFRLDVTGAIIMLAGIYYGTQYGGSTTAILINIPGEASAVVTCLDGYEMAKQGRAGPALGIAAFGSLIGGTVSVIGLMLLAPTLAEAALKFGPPEYFALLIMALSLVTYLSRGSFIKGLMMASLGLILATIGPAPITGKLRFTYNLDVLSSGLGIVPVLMGIFGIAEVLSNIGQTQERNVVETKIRGLLPTLQDWKDSFLPIIRGSIIGFFSGILPGFGLTTSAFISYGIEKKLSKHPERFGNGAIEGVAGPESANNANAGGHFVPMLSLGIPSGATMALLLGALMIHGIQPGPLLINERPDIFWGLIASMYIGNVVLVILNLPLIPMWVQVLRVPYSFLFPMILLFCMIGAYCLNNMAGEVGIMLVFGGVGYLFRHFGYEAPPLVLALILGPMIEDRLKQSLTISGGSFSIFFTRPISAFFLIITFLVLASSLWRQILLRKFKEK
jgi:putative tricarboxylic transport membrane protein